MEDEKNINKLCSQAFLELHENNIGSGLQRLKEATKLLYNAVKHSDGTLNIDIPLIIRSNGEKIPLVDVLFRLYMSNRKKGAYDISNKLIGIYMKLSNIDKTQSGIYQSCYLLYEVAVNYELMEETNLSEKYLNKCIDRIEESSFFAKVKFKELFDACHNKIQSYSTREENSSDTSENSDETYNNAF